MEEKEIIKLVQDTVKNEMAFGKRKITDTPTDALSVTNRKYVNLFGTTGSRPSASVAHLAQKYFDTTIGRPIYFNPNTSVWTDGAGSIS